MISNFPKKSILVDGSQQSHLNNLGEDFLPQQKYSLQEALHKFQFSVDNESFFEITEFIFANSVEPREMVKCAELAAQREPGGAFYRVKLWARIWELITTQKNNQSKPLKFSHLCTEAGIHFTRAKNLATQGQTILEVENSGIDTANLRQVSPLLFQYAQRQKDRAKEYLVEAINYLDKNPKATHTKIHKNWCQKNGNIKANLDIIKPSDWWAFSHPKWRKEDDFPGSIPGEIYANSLYYFAPKSGIAVDAMAGSGMLKRVYDDRDRWQKDSNFNLELHLFDLIPRRPFIKQHDATIPLPIKADWIFIDPPYYGQSNHLFSDSLSLAENYDNYLNTMQKILHSLAESLNDKGRLCVFLPKWSGFKFNDVNHNVPSDVALIITSFGLNWIDTAHVSRGRQQEQGSAIKNNLAKNERRMRSDTCILNVFEK